MASEYPFVFPPNPHPNVFGVLFPPNYMLSTTKSDITDSKQTTAFPQNSDSSRIPTAESNCGCDRDRPNLEENLAAMWPANTKLFSKDDDGIAVQIAAANKAVAAANKAVAAANKAANKLAAYAAATAHSGACVDDPDDDPDPAVVELQYKLLFEKARKALEHYKETMDEEYEFVENKRFETTILAPFYAHHITFTAKPKEKGDSSPKLFFAEVYQRFEHDDYEVKICKNLDSCGPDVMMGCNYSNGDEDMLHPSGVEFWAGPPSCALEWDEYKKGSKSSSPP